jgi:SAM-dependent methyltransferase
MTRPALQSLGAFDLQAHTYDDVWTNAPAGRAQRDAVWRRIDALFPVNAHILDLGCGTGEDAAHFQSKGLRVTAIDASPEMVRIARERGIDATALPIEDLGQLSGAFDGAISNFGALNCVADLAKLRLPLSALIRPGGRFALCTIGRFCLRESLYYLRRGQFRKAIRRWKGETQSASLHLKIFYPTVSQLKRAFAPAFELVETTGIGLFVPPSFIRPGRFLAQCRAIDTLLAHLPGFRAMADHRLVLFVRK